MGVCGSGSDEAVALVVALVVAVLGLEDGLFFWEADGVTDEVLGLGLDLLMLVGLGVIGETF